MTQPTARQSTTSNYGRFLLAALLILLLAAALRFHKLEAQSFWNDEGNSARLSERTIPLIPISARPEVVGIILAQPLECGE
jgi:putative copper export protein